MLEKKLYLELLVNTLGYGRTIEDNYFKNLEGFYIDGLPELTKVLKNASSKLIDDIQTSAFVLPQNIDGSSYIKKIELQKNLYENCIRYLSNENITSPLLQTNGISYYSIGYSFSGSYDECSINSDHQINIVYDRKNKILASMNRGTSINDDTIGINVYDVATDFSLQDFNALLERGRNSWKGYFQPLDQNQVNLFYKKIYYIMY